jgi:NADPH:quinone reductase-like Zn-dependent oxidoreductase
MFSRQFTILGSMMGTRADFRRVADLVGRRVLEPVIDSTFPLKEAIEAQRRMESRRFFGKILLVA